jgi:hypothetical protein
LELRNSNGDIVWCKDYYSCMDELPAEQCTLSIGCGVDLDIGVIEVCSLPNPVGYTDYRWPGDSCELQIPPDGTVGTYELTVTDHEGVSALSDPYALFKKRNIAWWFESDAAGVDYDIDGAVTLSLGDTFTYEAKRSRVCLYGAQSPVTISLSSQNRLAGLASVPGVDGPTASLFKLELGWDAAPEFANFTVDDDGCVRLYSEVNFGLSQAPARLTQVDGEPLTVVLGGVMHGEAVPLLNPSAEEGLGDDGMPVGWLLNQGEAANVSLVDGDNALEGTQSVRLEGYVTLRQYVEPPSPGPWLIRYLVNTSSDGPTTKCWVEVRQAYAEVDNPTSTYSTKPKCYPSSGGLSSGSCRFNAVEVHPVTGNPVELVGHSIRMGSVNADGDGEYCVFDEIRILKALDVF